MTLSEFAKKRQRIRKRNSMCAEKRAESLLRQFERRIARAQLWLGWRNHYSEPYTGSAEVVGDIQQRRHQLSEFMVRRRIERPIVFERAKARIRQGVLDAQV
jgi:hypothetical protein